MANVMNVEQTRRKKKMLQKRRSHRPGQRRRQRPTLRFTPYSWGKLLYLRDVGPTEVGGFGISAPGDLLLVEDFCLVDQRCTAITVQLEDTAVADFFDRQVDSGYRPDQFGRIWVHTHPGSCPLPSSTDEDTFRRCFGGTDWAVMFILAAGGATYARLQFHIGPQCRQRLQVEVDFSTEFAAASTSAWDAGYDDHVLAMDPFRISQPNRVATYFGHDLRTDDRSLNYGEVIDEWYARGDAIDLYSDTAEEEPCHSLHAAHG